MHFIYDSDSDFKLSCNTIIKIVIWQHDYSTKSERERERDVKWNKKRLRKGQMGKWKTD